MSPEPPDAAVSMNVPLAALVALAVEQWRLSRWLAAQPAGRAAQVGAARHALRKMEDFLGQCALEVRDLDGRPFDAGLAARVVDAVDDPRLPPGTAVVAETVSPLVLWRGNVVKPAEVVTRRGVAAEGHTPSPGTPGEGRGEGSLDF